MIWTLLDVLSLSLVVVMAGDALRRMHGGREPLRALAFAAVAVGSFGTIAGDLQQHGTSCWTALFHLGVAIYAGLHHHADARSNPAR